MQGAGGGLFTPALTNLFPGLNQQQEAARTAFLDALHNAGITPLFEGGNAAPLTIPPVATSGDAGGLSTFTRTDRLGTDTLSFENFVSPPEGSGFSSGLGLPSGSLDVPTLSFTESGGDLASGLTTPTGVSDATSLELSPDIQADVSNALPSGLFTTIPGLSGSNIFGGAQTSFYNWAVSVGVDLFLRIAIFIVGAIMLAVAVWAFAREPG